MDLYQILEKVCRKCNADAIALSGGLDSTILAYMMRTRSLQGITVIAKDFVATDLTYCQLAATKLSIPLHMVQPDIGDMLEAATQCISILGNFNDIQIRNSIVMFLVIKEAKKIGASSLVTGDGADELFAGYNFLLQMNPDQMSHNLRRLRQIMHFTSQDLGRSAGIKIESPFLHPDVVDVASKISAERHTGMHEGKRLGKMVLRQAFFDRIPSQIVWRTKSPMQDGAGTSRLRIALDSIITEDAFQTSIESIRKYDGVRIRTRESLFYYNEYKKLFGPPPPAAEDQKGCPYCNCALIPNSRLCRMCGAFPV